jgi:predicted N-acetyltransferase YhbS
MTTIRMERPADAGARDHLLDACFGENRLARTCERLREGRLPAEGLAFAATDGGSLVGTLRLWNIAAGPARPALMLGPLAVDPAWRERGIGGALMRHALAAAQGHAAILLLGDAPYYVRFGFSADKTAALWLPGPYEPERLLALELAPGALDGARGLVSPTGRPKPSPDLRRLVAAHRRADRRGLSHAA